MEAVSPTLTLVLHLRESIESGKSLQAGLHQFIKTSDDPLATHLRNWWIERETGRVPELKEFNLYQKMTLSLIERSLRGEAVSAQLESLQFELLQACEIQVDEFVQTLPLRCLLPLIGLIFPAYLLVLLGPLVENFLQVLRH